VDQKLIYNALEFFKLHWTLEILTALAEQPQRFNELQRSVHAMHSTPFNAALRRLVEHDLVRHPSQGDGTHYTLTAKGTRVIPLLEAFVAGIRWWEATNNDEEPLAPPSTPPCGSHSTREP
jgi:DNA-binding HxlR family transcriptional regulator